MLASGVFAGKHSLDWAYDRVDAKGKRFGDELERIGWKGEEKVGDRKMHAFFELHIEQGPILEAEGKDIGVVTHGQGLRWIECTVTGKESHTGSTPMHMRKNAGRGLALITELVHEIAMKNQPTRWAPSGISTSTRTRATSFPARSSSPSTCGPIFSTS
jgi:N-carbamoyl-L-amino-acid hydrolase